MSKILEIKNLSKTYGKGDNSYIALKDINIDISKGEFVGIMGPSGAGKSTLLNITSTIDTPTNGEVLIEGMDITKLKKAELAKFRQSKLGFIFQDFNLLDTLTVKENIALPLALAGKNPKIIEKQVLEIATTLGISDLLSKYPYEISGGQKQRTAASRAIITNPSLILADEPTGALDSKSSANLLESIERLNKENGATIMMVTHDATAASYCKKVIFIKDGVLYKELIRKDSQKGFFHEIMDTLISIGGE
ncbi:MULTISPECIES: ABC transporter ATP-binding protein [unclassified Clostridium]|uniref:ABC transporter ATP-binding protein n=1 Tax=unclassified Clostridium TaxID=2614128 RepID=UPI0002F85260|nr:MULTISPECIES: ABC transporter ATP-binding protein [unclassified Clostridium]MBN1044746.1 ABC transporter ATP-binding protein [Clostridium botulinum]NFR85966.1 ABC transporter ATP-binding protein [Clostridium botulinum]NFR89136.1 ABC transporter ATP-binding protein [Clostridium botulinum]NFT06525.1 ABC transporter ATP-binding protein [Clostridium botulinum]NFT99264.1 ABC transporter ATP-binding protein [Clostridium botulinum]